MIIQIVIVLFSCTSSYLLSSRKYLRWGFVVGLASQPLWIYSFIDKQQWGMLVVALWILLTQVRGIHNNFNLLRRSLEL